MNKIKYLFLIISLLMGVVIMVPTVSAQSCSGTLTRSYKTCSINPDGSCNTTNHTYGYSCVNFFGYCGACYDLGQKCTGKPCDISAALGGGTPCGGNETFEACGGSGPSPTPGGGGGGGGTGCAVISGAPPGLYQCGGSCGAGKDCKKTDGSPWCKCISTGGGPSPTPQQPSCQTYAGGSVVPNVANPGAPLTVTCRWGPPHGACGHIFLRDSSGNRSDLSGVCTWDNWYGDSATYHCPAPSTPGNYNVECTYDNAYGCIGGHCGDVPFTVSTPQCLNETVSANCSTNTVTVTTNASYNVNKFFWVVYNNDNLYGPGNPKPVCVTGGGDYNGNTSPCPAGSYVLTYTHSDTSSLRTQASRNFGYNQLFVSDTSWGGARAQHIMIAGYTQLNNGPVSPNNPNCHVNVNNCVSTITPTITPPGGATVTPPGGATVTPPGGATVTPPGGATVTPIGWPTATPTPFGFPTSTPTTTITPLPTATPMVVGTVRAIAKVMGADVFSCDDIRTGPTALAGTEFSIAPPGVPPGSQAQLDGIPVSWVVSAPGFYTLSNNPPVNYLARDICWTYDIVAPFTYFGRGNPAAQALPLQTLTAYVALGPPGPWAQTVIGDVYAKNSILSLIPDFNPLPQVRLSHSNPILGLGAFPYPGVVGYGSGYDFSADPANRGETAANNYLSLTRWLTNDTNVAKDFYSQLYLQLGAPQTSFGSNVTLLSPPLCPTDGACYFTGTLDISNNPWLVSATDKIVILVDGDLVINQNIRVAPGGFLAFIVSGNTTVSDTVGNSAPYDDASSATPDLEGVCVSNGAFIVKGPSSLQLVGKGSFIANNFSMERSLSGTANSTYPAFIFTHNPRLLLDMPLEMQHLPVLWRETAP